VNGGLSVVELGLTGRCNPSHWTSSDCWVTDVCCFLSQDVFQYALSGDWKYRGAYKSLARPTSRCILFDGENISFDASLVIYI
jgi:hypothetical protein